jgi:hypothetical protein
MWFILFDSLHPVGTAEVGENTHAIGGPIRLLMLREIQACTLRWGSGWQ